MKYFLLSLVMMIGAAVFFVIGTLWGSSFLMLTMCPGALIAIWFNGFAARASGIRISLDQQAAPKPRARRSEYN